MQRIVGVVTAGGKGAKVKSDDDFADRLSNRYTVIILVAFAVVVTAQTYVGSPLSCWVPAHFTGAHRKYTNSYCWVRNTYYLPFEPTLPGVEDRAERKHMIPYYQWIPFILLGQAVLFYLPSVVWHAFNQKVGVDADNILQSASSYQKTNRIEQRENVLKLVVNQFHRFLKAKSMKYYKDFHCDIKHIFTSLFKPCGTQFGNYLVLLFIITKFLYIANVIGQLFLLNDILATKYSIFGFEIVDYILKGQDWTESPGVAFPRVTLCDFNIRRLGNVHSYTVQCTLPINMYNEKIYMFIWFWMVFVAVWTCLDLIVWIVRFISKQDKMGFLLNHLQIAKLIDMDDEDDMKDVRNFYEYYLRQDGVFLLRLIAHNTNNITVTEITGALWEKYQIWKRESPALPFEDTASIPSSGVEEDGIEMTEKQKLAEEMM